MKNKSFYLLATGQTLANAGDVFYILVLISIIYKETQSVFYISFVPLINMVSGTISSILAPFIIDKYNLKRILVYSQLCKTMILLIITLYASYFMSDQTIHIIYLFVFLISFLDGWANPASGALLPILVPDDKLTKANSLLSTLSQCVQLGGWAVGGILAAFLHSIGLFWLTFWLYALSTIMTALINDLAKTEIPTDSSSSGNKILTMLEVGAVLAGVLLVYVSVTTLFIIAIIAYFLLLMSTLFLRIEEPSITSRHSSEQTGRNIKGHRSFHEILSVINRLPIIKMILILTVFPFIFIGGFNLMVINISQLQDSSLIKGLLYGAEGLSIFIAGLTASRLKKGKNSVPLLLISCLLIGVAQMSLFLAEWRWLPVVSFALFGYVVGIFMPLSNTVCQELIPDEYLGRFFSLRRMLESFVQQVSVLCTGVLLDWIGFHWTVILLGLLTFTIVGLLCIRQLYEPIHYIQETKIDQ